MKLADLIVELKNKLLEANGKDDTRFLNELFTAFTVLEDVFQSNFDGAAIAILVDLKAACSDKLTGVEWKSEIPSDEQIHHAFSD